MAVTGRNAAMWNSGRSHCGIGWTRSGQFLGYDFAAQCQAFGADRDPGSGCKPGDLVAALAAEAALDGSAVLVVVADWCHRGKRSGGWLASRDHPVCPVDAFVADVHPGAGDELSDLLLLLAAERAFQHRARLGIALARADDAAPGPGAPCSLDDLVDPLVAEAERIGDLAQRAAGELQPAHRVVEVHPGDAGGAFGVDEARLGCTRRGEQFGIDWHDVYRT